VLWLIELAWACRGAIAARAPKLVVVSWVPTPPTGPTG
jgi:hypothetical protein